ncbi:uncharacterized protein IL334_004575 [Kwoniella shivajii]|uniref:Vps72/YL1 C-terminal domain-containing protein n=1 Tax=Kwoniella shivajii TaxID=564305 RepID=A0ABZ1D1B7_9TREE|nr:hypothetical protein IL334_004575 [Kwoniella shivajii]
MSNHETVTTGRAKRSTAGNRMRELLERAHQEDDDELFQEVENDEEFTAPQEVKDVFLDEFADTDEEVEMDEEAEERALRREERKKEKGKSKAIYDPTAKISKSNSKSRPDTTDKLLSDPSLSLLDPNIDASRMAPSTLILTLRRKRREAKREQRSEARRSNLRASTLQTEKEIVEREAQAKANRGNKGRRAQHETGEVRGARPMTQDELIAAALEEEERNKEALRDWLKKEDERRELRRVGRKRVKGPRWTWVSRTVERLIEVIGEENVVKEVTATEKRAEKAEEKKNMDQPSMTVTTDQQSVLPEGNTTVDEEVKQGTATGGNAEEKKDAITTDKLAGDDTSHSQGVQSEGDITTARDQLPIPDETLLNPDGAVHADIFTDQPAADPLDGSSASASMKSIIEQKADESIAAPDLTANDPTITPQPPGTEDASTQESQSLSESHPSTSAKEPSTVNAEGGTFPPVPGSDKPKESPTSPSKQISDTAVPKGPAVPDALPPIASSSSDPSHAIARPSGTTVAPPSINRPAVTEPVNEENKYTRNYLILSQVPGGLSEELRLILGGHVEWDDVMYIPARNRPINRKPPICAFTGLPAKYRHPTTMIPYATAEGYKHIQALLQERYKYDDGGWWLGGEEDVRADGMEGVEGWWEATNGGWMDGKEIPEPVEKMEQMPAEVMEEIEPVEEVVLVRGKRKTVGESASSTPVPIAKKTKGKGKASVIEGDEAVSSPVEGLKRSKSRGKRN